MSSRITEPFETVNCIFQKILNIIFNTFRVK